MEFVNFREQEYNPEVEVREKPGTPGILQALRGALALQVKERLGPERIEERERELARLAMERLRGNPAIELIGNPDPDKRLPIFSFNIRAGDSCLHARFVALLLNDLFGIQGRAGCSCAGPYGHRVLHIDEKKSLEFKQAIMAGHVGLEAPQLPASGGALRAGGGAGGPPGRVRPAEGEGGRLVPQLSRAGPPASQSAQAEFRRGRSGRDRTGADPVPVRETTSGRNAAITVHYHYYMANQRTRASRVASQASRSREFHSEGEHHYDRSSPARWVLSHTLRYPLFALLMIGASVVNNIAYGNIQLYIGKSFDRIVTPGWSPAALLGLVLVIIGSAVVQGVTGLARNFSVEFLAQAIERDAREEYYASLLEKSQTFHGRQRVGELMARATYDVHTLNLMFSPGIMLIIDSILTYAVPMAMIALIHPRLLLTPVLFSVVLALTVWEYNHRLKPVSLAQQDQYGKLSAGLEEAIAGIVAVKASVQENYEWKKFTGDSRAFRDYYVQQGIIQARYWPLLAFAIFWGAGLFHGLWLWHQGVISIGSVVGFLMLFNAFRFVTFISLFSFNMVQHGMASAGRILSVIKTATDLDQNLEGQRRKINGLIEFRGVSFGYNGSQVLCDLSFQVQPGETVAIVGQTGSGKTTLTRLVNRIFDPGEGSVLVDNVDLRAWSLESLRSQIASIEQDVFLFSQSIRENIAFGRAEASQDEIEEAARQAQAHEFITAFAQGYDTVVGERGVMLSGGQKQRIAIARAFLTDPRILILDDSTSAIDSKTEDEIQKAMLRISRSRTTLIITHRLSLIRRADRILVLRRGQIADQGRHEELLGRSPDYRRIFAGL